MLDTVMEIFGYCGSALVVASLLMSSVVRLRVLNSIGSLISMIYALYTHTYPIALMNASLVAINLYHLFHIFHRKTAFDMVRTAAADGSIAHFLRVYQEDIRRYFPDFQADAAGLEAFVVYTGAVPAGLLLGTLREDGVLEAQLDYTTPAYRDCSVGKYLYENLAQSGVKTIRQTTQVPEHARYLTNMGFTQHGDAYCKQL